jgi:hypothetical protein
MLVRESACFLFSQDMSVLEGALVHCSSLGKKLGSDGPFVAEGIVAYIELNSPISPPAPLLRSVAVYVVPPPQRLILLAPETGTKKSDLVDENTVDLQDDYGGSL